MSLESQRPADPLGTACIEAGCDRPATEGDERCELHQQRLGAWPSKPSPRAVPVVVESALDASVAVARPRSPDRARMYRRGLLAFLGGVTGFWGSIVGSGALEWRVGPALYAFFAVALAMGGVATWGGASCISQADSTARRALGFVLVLLAQVPEALAALLVLVVLADHRLF